MIVSSASVEPNYAASLKEVREAAERIAPFAHRTPVITSQTLDDLAGRELFFKCENLQKVGAFKFRGACNAVLKLSDDEAQRGVLTHSSGNHAQALALAARMREIPAYIVMPNNAPRVKRDATISYGAKVIECEPTLQAREDVAARVQAETAARFVPSYDHPEVIAGQGTTALELMEQVSNLDIIVAPVGGGGLISGICIAAKALNPAIRIVAAEPSGADDAARSFAAGQLLRQTDPQTIADGLLTSLGQLTWPIIRDHLETIITVSESELIAAMQLMWQRTKLLIEPSSAVAVAAVLSESFQRIPGTRVGVVLSGGNVDLTKLPWQSDES